MHVFIIFITKLIASCLNINKEFEFLNFQSKLLLPLLLIGRDQSRRLMPNVHNIFYNYPLYTKTVLLLLFTSLCNNVYDINKNM